MKQQATRYTPKQLAYLAYWESRGYTFAPGAVVPENTTMPPDSWSLPSWIDLAFAAVFLLAIAIALLKGA